MTITLSLISLILIVVALILVGRLKELSIKLKFDDDNQPPK
jgi:hypothetical protein